MSLTAGLAGGGRLVRSATGAVGKITVASRVLGRETSAAPRAGA